MRTIKTFMIALGMAATLGATPALAVKGPATSEPEKEERAP